MNEIEKEALQTVSACHEVEVGALNTAVSLLKDTVEKQEFQISAYHTDISMLKTKVEKLKRDYAKESYELEQILGKALGYPIYPEGGPGPVGDVCVGDNIPASLAMEAAQKIVALSAAVGRVGKLYEDTRDSLLKQLETAKSQGAYWRNEAVAWQAQADRNSAMLQISESELVKSHQRL